MRTREKVELALAALAVPAAAFGLRGFLPGNLPWGELGIYASALLLAQSLVRDLYIKYGAPKPPPPDPNAPPQRNLMCLESTIGMAGILAGACLLFAWPQWRVGLPGWFWPAFLFAVGLTGFLIKDLVLDWRRMRVEVEKDHQNVIWW